LKEKTAALTTIRELKGPPLTILIAIFVAQQPVSQNWLCEMLGYDQKTVKRHLGYLRHGGYVERTDFQSWQLVGGRPGLAALQSLLPPPSEPAPEPAAESYPQSYPQQGATEDSKTGNFPTFSPTTTCSKPVEEKSSKSSSTEAKPEKIPISPELAAVLQEAGIGRNLWPELAALPHVAPAYVRAQLARVKEHPDPAKRTTGFLIHVLRCGDPVPQVCPHCQGTQEEHRLGCPERYSRYTKGKYAHLMQH
jgi:hypothetical protein